MKLLTKSRRYRFTEDEFLMIEKLKKENVIESKFVRNAIKEKFERDYPKLLKNKNKIFCPF